MDEYTQRLKEVHKQLNPCKCCGKKPSIVPAPYIEDPTGNWFWIACSCGIKTISDDLEDNLKRWNRRAK